MRIIPLILWATAATAMQDSLEAVPLEANGLPADKWFPELQELVRLGCPKEGQIPKLVIPKNPVVGTSTYIAKYFDMLPDCSNSSKPSLHQRGLTHQATLLGNTINIGKASYETGTSADNFGSPLVEEPLPQECFTSSPASQGGFDTLLANSPYDLSESMAMRADIKNSLGAFGGSIYTLNEEKGDLSKKRSYYRYDFWSIEGTAHFRLGCLNKFISPDLKARILAIEPEELPKNSPEHPGYKPYKALLEKYGTHYVHSMGLGGSYEISSTTETADFNSSNGQHEKNNIPHLHVQIFGGAAAEMSNLEEAIKTGQSVDQKFSDWVNTIAGHVAPIDLSYRPLFQDVIPYAFKDDEPRQATFLANMKQASHYVAREAWKDFCLEDMWDDKSLTCRQIEAMNFMGRWIYLLRFNRCLFFNKSKRIIQLNDHISGPCSEFRMEEERGSVEVRGEEGILAYINGDTSNVSINDKDMYASSYAEFRFTYEGGLRVRCKGEEGSYLYAKGDFLHLGPNSENLAIADFSFSVKQVENPVPSEQEKNTPFEQAEGWLPDIRTGSTVPSDQEQEKEQKNESLQTPFKQAQETERHNKVVGNSAVFNAPHFDAGAIFMMLFMGLCIYD